MCWLQDVLLRTKHDANARRLGGDVDAMFADEFIYFDSQTSRTYSPQGMNFQPILYAFD